MAILTFNDAKERLANIAVHDQDIGEMIQEVVDRAFEMGRWRGMIQEVKIDYSSYIYNKEENEYYVDFPITEHDGALGFRWCHGGFGIQDQLGLFRDGRKQGNLSFIDLDEVEVEGVTVRRYRCPDCFKPSESFPIWVLLKKLSPTLSNTDIVPIRSIGALKAGVLAASYEIVNDEERAQFNWNKFETLMEKQQRQFNGIRQYHIGMQSSLRRAPRQFM